MMRRSRVSEMPQRKSLRAPLQRRTSSPESVGSHPTMTKRPTADRNSKLGDRCSPRNPLVEQKKLRTRICDLESQLGQVQEELKKFKEQLAFAEVDKNRETEVVEKTNKRIPAQDHPPQMQEENSSLRKLPEENLISMANLETEVFEVPLAVAVQSEPSTDLTHVINQKDHETEPNAACSELVAEPNKLVGRSNALEKMGMSELKVILAKKKEEIESITAENDKLKQQVSEEAAKVTLAQAKEEETALKLSHIGVELEESKAEAARAAEELKAAVDAKLTLETEMKKLRVQTQQWKKAASEAASVLAGEVEVGGQKVAVQSSSLGKHVGFELAGYGSFDTADDFDEGLESGKRKGTGIRMFGDLWKKKGQK